MDNGYHEYCPRCEANLTLQKGYDNSFPYWICRGCGEMLINPEVEAPGDVAWICDKCGSMLNIQSGFHDRCGEFKCEVCGFVNRIDDSTLYDSEDEFQADLHNPYKGLTDEQVLKLSQYESVKYQDDREDVQLVKDPESGRLYIRKFLTTYELSVYEYLMEHPVSHMPRIVYLAEGDNCLIVVEEYIEGNTLQKILTQGTFDRNTAIDTAGSICRILFDLHNLPTPIVHRDIKPSNIIITKEGEVYLLDVNAAKWYDSSKTDDTNHIGTPDYAAPEQAGFGLTASSAKSDIYAVGVLINVMLTGKIPKAAKAPDYIWPVVERCISLDTVQRYDAGQLIRELERRRV